MILLLLAPALLAQSVLTMEEAIATALKNHPDAAAVRMARDVTSAQVTQSQALPQPELRMSFNSFGVDPETQEARTNLGLRWSPPRPRELGLKKRIAAARQGVVEASIESFEARVAAETRLAFRRALLAAERVRYAELSVSLRGKVLDVVKRQVAAGLKEATEEDLAELTVADAQSELRRLRNIEQAERRALLRLVAAPEGTDYRLAPMDGLLETPAPLAIREAARAEVRQAISTCKEADAAVALARNQFYPWISFTQVTRRVSVLENRGPWSFQFGVELPLFRTAAKAEAKVAAAQSARCRLEQQALERRVANEVSEAAAALEAARLELIELERVRTGLATRALERTHKALASGRSDQVEVLLAEVRTVTLRDRWLERRMEYARLESQYENALGIR